MRFDVRHEDEKQVGEVWRTVITEIKILSMRFYALNLNHRVTDVNRLWIMVRVWKRKFHFDGGKTKHL